MAVLVFVTELRLYADLVEPEFETIDLGILSPMKPIYFSFSLKNKVNVPVRVKSQIPASPTCITQITLLNPDQVVLGLKTITLTMEIHPSAIPINKTELEVDRTLYLGVGSAENIKHLTITGIVAKPSFQILNQQGLMLEKGDNVPFPGVCPREWSAIDLIIRNTGVMSLHWLADVSNFILAAK
jgi:hypothetical protein